MGYNISIGEKIWSTDDPESTHWAVVPEENDLSPEIPGACSIYKGKNRSYSNSIGLHDFVEAVKLRELFSDNGILYGENQVITLNGEFLEKFETLAKSYIRSYPDEWWKIATLNWMLFWIKKSIKTCKDPVICIY